MRHALAKPDKNQARKDIKRWSNPRQYSAKDKEERRSMMTKKALERRRKYDKMSEGNTQSVKPPTDSSNRDIHVN